jgi:hypothetical protein
VSGSVEPHCPRERRWRASLLTRTPLRIPTGPRHRGAGRDRDVVPASVASSLTSSSTREDVAYPQIYITAVVSGKTGVETFPARYLRNQPADEGNHTPAWDSFQIPIP